MKNLIQALVSARAEMTAPKKTSSNPAFRSKFADLAAILEAVEPALTKHGLAVTQSMRTAPEGVMLLDTTLWHTSGESLTSTAELHPEKATLQGLGSAITYLRRYQLQALLCLAAEDDDGNAASAPRTAQAAKPAPQPAKTDDAWTLTHDQRAEAAAQIEAILAAIAASKTDVELTEVVQVLSDAKSLISRAMSDEQRKTVRAAFAKRRKELGQ